MSLTFRSFVFLGSALLAVSFFAAESAEAGIPGEALLPLGFYGSLNPTDEPLVEIDFEHTKNSSGEYLCTVTNTSMELDISDYTYYLVDGSRTVNEFGYVAMQNISGNVVGIDVSYENTCGDSCDDDLQTRSDAVDADDGSTYAVTFNDNDRDGKLSAGDKFTARGSGHSSEGPAGDDWSLEILHHLSGSIAGAAMRDYTDDPYYFVGRAEYDQYPDFRSNREPTYTGTWTYTATSLTTLYLEQLQLWFERTDDEYDPACEWHVYLGVDSDSGDNGTSFTLTCQHDGDTLAMDSYPFNLSFTLEQGQTLDLELWYEGWEDVNIYAGTESYSSGITVTGWGRLVVGSATSDSATEIDDFGENTSMTGYTEMFGVPVELSISAHTESYSDNLSYVWTSDVNGVIGNESSITASNLSAGLHLITATVSGEVCECSKVRYLSLDVTASPTAHAGAPVTVYANVPVQFNGQGSDVDGSIEQWEWDFDDNGIFDWSSDQNGLTTYIFNSPGDYSVTLRVTDDDGLTGTAVREVTVVAIPDLPESPSDNQTGNDTSNDDGGGETTGSGLPGFGAAGGIAALVTAGVVASFRRHQRLR